MASTGMVDEYRLHMEGMLSDGRPKSSRSFFTPILTVKTGNGTLFAGKLLKSSYGLPKKVDQSAVQQQYEGDGPLLGEC